MKRLLPLLLVFTLAFQLVTIPASAATKSLDEAVKEIVKIVPEGASDLEKVTLLREWMYYNVAGVGPTKNTAYTALVERKAACHGFAVAFRLLLEEVGVECKYISGRSVMGPHAWNQVKLDGNWYYIDTSYPGTSHWGTFLRSDDTLRGYYWDKERYPATPKVSYGGTDERYDFTSKGDSVYYYDSDSKSVKRYNSTTRKTTTISPTTGKIIYLYGVGDYVVYRLNKEVYFYNTKTGDTTTATIKGDLLDMSGDNIFFAEYSDSNGDYKNDTLCLNVFNVKTQKIHKTESVAQFANNLHYTGVYNKKVYFYDMYDIYCYDIVKKSFYKLRRPDDVRNIDAYFVADKRFIAKLEIVEKNGTVYLRWEMSGKEGIVKMRKIT